MIILGIDNNASDDCEDVIEAFYTVVSKAPESITLEGLEVRFCKKKVHYAFHIAQQHVNAYYYPILNPFSPFIY